jgi:hypothetical protein
VKEWMHHKFRMPHPELPDYIAWSVIIVLLIIIHTAAS